jgi:hypothetical protein
MADSNLQERALEHLSEALDTEERAEKQFQIREALQLLSMGDAEPPTTE